MAYEIPGFKLGTLLAAADLSAAQYCFVRVDNTGKVALGPSATGGRCIGVLYNKPTLGQACEIVVNGVVFFKSDAVGLTAGDGIEAVITTGAGQVATGGTTNVLGTVLETVAANGIGTAFISCGAGYIET